MKLIFNAISEQFQSDFRAISEQFQSRFKSPRFLSVLPAFEARPTPPFTALFQKRFQSNFRAISEHLTEFLKRFSEIDNYFEMLNC